MNKDINKKILFLNNIWDKAYCNYRNIANNNVLNRVNFKLLRKVVKTLDVDSYNAYNFTSSIRLYTGGNPSITIHSDTSSKTVDRFNCYKNLLPVINLLIKSLSDNDNHNAFGEFIAEWNKIALLIERKTSLKFIAIDIYNYETIHLHYWTNYDNNTIKSYLDAKDILISDARFISERISNKQERFILNQIIKTNNWDTLIKKFVQNNLSNKIEKRNDKESIANIIKQNATKITQHGSSNSKITNYLAKLNILCGANLQQKIVDAINDNATGFKSIYHYGIALSKITNYHTFYRYSATNICDIHVLTSKDLINTINSHFRILKHYHVLLKKQKRINDKVQRMKNKYNF